MDEIEQSTTVVIPASKTMEYGFMSAWIFGSDGSPSAQNKHGDEDQLEELDDLSDEEEKVYRKLRKRATGTSSLASSSTKIFSSATATATGTNGCVECPTVECPECGSNYYCVLTSLTCTQCPLTYCALKPSTTDSSSSASASDSNHNGKKNVGAIAGGVVGGVGGAIVIFLGLYFFYYKKYYSKNRLVHAGDGSYVDKHFADDDDDDYENGEKRNFNKNSEYDGSVAAHVGSSAPASSIAQGNDYNSSQENQKVLI